MDELSEWVEMRRSKTASWIYCICGDAAGKWNKGGGMATLRQSSDAWERIPPGVMCQLALQWRC
jgi:hypothetical protein